MPEVAEIGRKMPRERFELWSAVECSVSDWRSQLDVCRAALSHALEGLEGQGLDIGPLYGVRDILHNLEVTMQPQLYAYFTEEPEPLDV